MHNGDDSKSPIISKASEGEEMEVENDADKSPTNSGSEEVEVENDADAEELDNRVPKKKMSSRKTRNRSNWKNAEYIGKKLL